MKKEYDWIDDPFKEPEPTDTSKKMSRGSKLAIGCSFILVIVGVVMVSVLACSALVDISL